MTWTSDDPDSLSRFPEKIAALKKELKDTEKSIKKQKDELKKRFQDGSMEPSERRAVSAMCSALTIVKDRVLKDIHNVQESWRKAAERFRKKDRQKKQRKRKTTSITYFMGRELKKNKFKDWKLAAPDNVGRTVLVVGKGKATIGRGTLKQIVFGPRLEGVVQFEQKDEATICFADEQFKPNAELLFKTNGVVFEQFPLSNILVEQCQTSESETEEVEECLTSESEMGGGSVFEDPIPGFDGDLYAPSENADDGYDCDVYAPSENAEEFMYALSPSENAAKVLSLVGEEG